MAKYSYITDKTHNNRKIQVESAKRDGSGKNIENNYAKQNGNYQSLTAGLSNNFDTKLTEKDESAYNFRPTATMGSMELEVGSPCKVKKIIGGSVAFNQLIREISSSYWNTSNATSSFSNGVCSFTASAYRGKVSTSPRTMPTTPTHKVLISVDIKTTTATTSVRIYAYGGYVTKNVVSTTSWQNVSRLEELNSNWGSDLTNQNALSIEDTRDSSWDEVQFKNAMCIDLTQRFGSTIADYIYSLEQANAGSGVAWFKRYFPKEYYAYNSGELVSVKTQGKKITHFNQWDEEWELGAYNGTTGAKQSSSTEIRCKNKIRVVNNTQYCFTIIGKATSYPQNNVAIFQYDNSENYIGLATINSSGLFTTDNNCSYVTFYVASGYGTTYNHDVCINFHYDGERDGEYEPYNSETYACDDIELRGIPQLDENNNLAFDGDEYANDGNVTRKKYVQRFTGSETGWGVATQPNTFTLECNKFPVRPKNSILDNDTTFVYGSWKKLQPQEIGTENGIYTAHTYTLYVTATGCSTLSELQTYLASNPLILGYDISETTETSIPFTEVQECDNWGTEEWLAPTTDTRPCEVPVGHETDYLPDLKAKLEVAPNTPNENGVYVMEHNASGNTYTLIGTWLANNGYKTEETMKGTFGMKDALGGTLRQLLANKKNIDFLNTAYIDLSSVTFAYSLDNACFYSTSILPNVSQSTTYDRCLCTMYKSANAASVAGLNNMEVSIDAEGYLQVKNTSYTDPTAFKNAMKGVLLAYEKAS